MKYIHLMIYSKKNKMNERIELIISDLSFQNKKIILFGVGGVGGTALEAIVRSGIKNIDIYDFDTVDASNLNRQIISNTENIGHKKIDEAILRAKAINPNINIRGFDLKLNEENIKDLDLKADFVIDAIDDVKAKVALIKRCVKENINIISSQGTGNKLDPSKLEITDISKTEYCPLAKKVRKLLRDEGINHLTVVYSKEQREIKKDATKIGTMMFVPSAAGLLIASYVIRKLIGEI